MSEMRDWADDAVDGRAGRIVLETIHDLSTPSEPAPLGLVLTEVIEEGIEPPEAEAIIERLLDQGRIYKPSGHDEYRVV